MVQLGPNNIKDVSRDLFAAIRSDTRLPNLGKNREEFASQFPGSGARQNSRRVPGTPGGRVWFGLTLDAAGEMLAMETLTVLPNGHDAKNMESLFGLASFTGSLESHLYGAHRQSVDQFGSRPRLLPPCLRLKLSIPPQAGSVGRPGCPPGRWEPICATAHKTCGNPARVSK